jgi:hypothetical protein
MKPLLLLSLCSVCLWFSLEGNSFAQANRNNTGDVTCPATGTSIEVMPGRSSRFSYLLNNINGQPVRIGYVATGTAALTAANSWVLQPGQATADSIPGVLSLRIVCMSTTATSNLITFNETYR